MYWEGINGENTVLDFYHYIVNECFDCFSLSAGCQFLSNNLVVPSNIILAFYLKISDLLGIRLPSRNLEIVVLGLFVISLKSWLRFVLAC